MQFPKSIEKAVEVLVCAAPVFKREFIGILRSRMGFWVAVGTVAVTGLVPMLAWPSEAEKTSAGMVGEICVIPLLLTTYSMLLAPHVSIRAEFKKGTFEQLLVTRLPPASILLGIHFAFIAFAALIVLLTAPLTVFYLRRVTFIDSRMLEPYGVLLVLATVTGGWVAPRKEAPTWQHTNQWAQFVPWSYAAIVLLGGTLSNFASPLVRYSIYAFVLAVMTVISLRALKRVDLRLQFQPPKKLTGLAGLLQGLPLEHRRRLSKTPPRSFPDGVNPVSHLTRHFRRATLTGSDLRSYLVGLTLILGLFFLGVLTFTYQLGVTLYAFTGFFFFSSVAGSAAMTALLVQREHDQETLDNLRATPLTVFEILWGKLTGTFGMPSWRGFYVGAVAVFALAAIFFWMDMQTCVFSFLFIPAFAVVVTLGSTAGLLGAALSRDTVQAVILAFAVFLAPLILVPLLLGPMESVSQVMSPLVGYYAAVYEYRASNVFSPGAFLLSLPVGLALAGLQFFLSVRLLERKWMRGG